MKSIIKLGAAGAAIVLAVAACEVEEQPITRIEADVLAGQTTAPAPPVETAGTIQPANTLNGDYNLRTTECGQAGSEGALSVSGSRFQFSAAQCTAISSTTRADAAEVRLNCTGNDGNTFQRLTLLRLSPGILHIEENNAGLRYYRCPAA
ncbi:MAG: hypothetical protein Q4G25_13520 [Paracoccus sp. (in: a-proteobacteria)]|nr:hypothetical protein [Paracoccus sp. (in: a-proteobacteria)]